MIKKFLPLCFMLPFCTSAMESATPVNFNGWKPEPGKPPREMYAHYMGCYPLSSKISGTVKAQHNLKKVKADSPKTMEAFGSPWRNTPLVPWNYEVYAVDAAEMEIKRALRTGLSGFAFDVLPGRELSLKTIPSFFAAAKRGNYPIKFTFCLDNPWRNPAVIAWILENYGNSPHLARRNGKVMFFGYHSFTDAREFVHEYLERKKGNNKVPAVFFRETSIKGLPQLTRDKLDFPDINSMKDLQLTQAGWSAHGKVYRFYEKKFNQPFFIVYDQNLGPNPGEFKNKDDYYQAIKTLANDLDAVGRFFWNSNDKPEETAKTAQIVRAAGKEWWEAVFYQYENSNWQKTRLVPGASLLRRRWQDVFNNKCTLIQFATWNDYTENTNLSPSFEYHYAYFDLNRFLIDWWKNGKPDKITRDRIYVFYNLYPRKSEIWPFRRTQLNDFESVIEVITLATSPGIMTLPGRNVSRKIPAGMSYFQVPATPGPVIAKLHRDGKLAKSLHAPEPITAHPFRQQLVNAAFSTEFERNWREDFVEAEKIADRGYYADDDKDGMPNWFEMYFFGKYGDFSTATAADPNADPNHDGINNLQSYKMKIDPVRPRPQYKPGFTWNPLADIAPDHSFNPDYDKNQRPVWYYKLLLRKKGDTSGKGVETIVENSYRKLSHSLTRHNLTYSSDLAKKYQGGWVIQNWPKKAPRNIEFSTGINSAAIMEFISPVNGTLKIAGSVKCIAPATWLITAPNGVPVTKYVMKRGEAKSFSIVSVPVKAGERIRFLANASNSDKSGKIILDALSMTLIK